MEARKKGECTADTILLSVEKFCAACDFKNAVIWMNLQRPITEAEIKRAIKLQQFISPADVKPEHWRRKHHIQRIAYLVVFWEEGHPIDVEFSIPALGFSPTWPIADGNHRMHAAVYRQEKYIHANWGGQVSEMQKYRHEEIAEKVMNV